MSFPCQIQAKPDISGIGIRIGIYITSYLIAGVPNPDCSHYGIDKLRGVLLQAAGLNGFALLITAVVQTGAHIFIHNWGGAAQFLDRMNKRNVNWICTMPLSSFIN
jgi:hypothetical protein